AIDAPDLVDQLSEAGRPRCGHPGSQLDAHAEQGDVLLLGNASPSQNELAIARRPRLPLGIRLELDLAAPTTLFHPQMWHQHHLKPSGVSLIDREFDGGSIL